MTETKRIKQDDELQHWKWTKEELDAHYAEFNENDAEDSTSISMMKERFRKDPSQILVFTSYPDCKRYAWNPETDQVERVRPPGPKVWPFQNFVNRVNNVYTKTKAVEFKELVNPYADKDAEGSDELLAFLKEKWTMGDDVELEVMQEIWEDFRHLFYPDDEGVEDMKYYNSDYDEEVEYEYGDDDPGFNISGVLFAKECVLDEFGFRVESNNYLTYFYWMLVHYMHSGQEYTIPDGF